MCNLFVQGEKLDYGCGSSLECGYAVLIGKELATILDITNNEITCKPPQYEPSSDQRYKGSVPVYVSNVLVNYMYMLPSTCFRNVYTSYIKYVHCKTILSSLKVNLIYLMNFGQHL